MFGRRKRKEAAEAAREAERRALFAKLAERPDNICPFLGLAGERTGYVDGVSDEHRCYAFGDPAPLSAEQQTRVCQERGYGNCPRYLRGVLVIPTEELEALRRPRPAAPYVPPSPPEAGYEGRRRRAAPLLLLLLLLVAVGAGGGAAWLLFGDRLVGLQDETPSPQPTQPTPSASPAPSLLPSAAPSLTPEPTGTPRPTPRPEDVFLYYEVEVERGEHELFQVDDAGDVMDRQVVPFSRRSVARVDDAIDMPGGRHWRTAEGPLTGWSYIYPDSGDFKVYAVYQRIEGDQSYRQVEPPE